MTIMTTSTPLAKRRKCRWWESDDLLLGYWPVTEDMTTYPVPNVTGNRDIVLAGNGAVADGYFQSNRLTYNSKARTEYMYLSPSEWWAMRQGIGVCFWFYTEASWILYQYANKICHVSSILYGNSYYPQYAIRFEMFTDPCAAYVTSDGLGTTVITLSDVGAFPFGQWNHVAFTRSATESWFYFNGVKYASPNTIGIGPNRLQDAINKFQTVFGNAQTGVYGGGNYGTLRVKAPAITLRPLSETEVLAHYYGSLE
jgi:hypothetical protein